MKSTNKYFGAIAFLVLTPLSFISCDDEVDDPYYISVLVKEAIYEGMQDWYYWNEELPTNIRLQNYGSNEELLEDLTYKNLDKWSYLTTIDAFDKAFTGQNAGHGVGYTLDQEGKVFLTFVYEESPAGKDGWQRGWEIVEVNQRPISSYKVGNGYDLQLGPNTSGVNNTFKLRLPDGSTVERTISKEEYQSNSVLHQSVIVEENKKIGYWVYNSFKATPQVQPTRSVEVEESMAYFEENGISELIIDLRYNGGGSVAVAEQIMNYLVPADATGKLMYTNAFNQNKSKLNEEQHFKKTGNLALERLVFITSRGSASSSELVINCLSPYMETILIGDNTYGKPVGAFPLSGFYKPLKENNVELVPITFAIANAEGQAAYYDGFPVDFSAADDLTRNWGDLEEDRLKASLSYIRNGSFGTADKRHYTPPSWAMIDNFRGLQQEFPVY